MDDLYQDGEVLREQGKVLQQEYLKLKDIMEQCSQVVNKIHHDTAQLRMKGSMNICSNVTSKLLGNANVGLSQNVVSNVLKLSKMLFSTLGNARAGGGNVSSGVPYLVGERGAEMFVPHASGNIIANKDLSKHAPINITMNISTPDVTGFAKSHAQIISEISRAMKGRNF